MFSSNMFKVKPPTTVLKDGQTNKRGEREKTLTATGYASNPKCVEEMEFSENLTSKAERFKPKTDSNFSSSFWNMTSSTAAPTRESVPPTRNDHNSLFSSKTSTSAQSSSGRRPNSMETSFQSKRERKVTSEYDDNDNEESDVPGFRTAREQLVCHHLY